MFNNTYERGFIEDALESVPGIVVTDIQGKIVYITQTYADILGVNAKESLGKDVEDVIPHTRMRIVSETGKEEVGSIFKLRNGETVIVNRFPVKKNGRIIGAIAYGSLVKTGQYNTNTTIELIKRLDQEIDQYKTELNKLRGAKYSLDQIIGSTSEIVKLKELIKKVAQTKSTVLITGETGTGKELVAHAIHQLSPRNHHPFIRVNCAAIPGELLESELFGYEEGAFTGAKKGGRIGKFELAHCGTLLLDEINQMPVYLQSKLLRVIQEKEIERVGSNKPIEIDVRLIFTTNENLFNLVKKGVFREDLYYRINVVTIDTPPLRTRIDDMPLLIECFIKKINRELGLNIQGVTKEVLELFRSYHWPGNIRELEHSLERAANMVLSGVLGIEQFSNLILRIKTENIQQIQNDTDSLSSLRDKVEREAIIEVLRKTNMNVRLAASILKIHKSVLYEKIKKYGIQI